ncbi:MAG TPA: glucose 1-dehydrogenase [Candidatus Methylomirabilis sp.]|nr:glucose 1-dehydrogenase [Candidatus Methylomirabilis sp.]
MTLEEIFGLAGRTAVITGGASGLGKGMASALAAAGASLVLVDVQGDLAEATVHELSSHGTEVIALPGDVTDPGFLDQTLSTVLAKCGRVDILVCAAGRALRKNALESTDADFDALMAVNVKAVFQWNRAFGRHMIERGKGAIINIASQGAFSALAGRPLYSASKASIVQLTKTLALDWIKFGVRVNAIAPGLMDTPFIAEMKREPTRIERDVARIPAGRLGRPDDLAGAVLLLASDAGRYIVGQTLIVDGGWTIY